MKLTLNQSILYVLLASTTSQALRGGQRSRKLTKHSNTVSPNYIPYTGDCALGQGFDVVEGCVSTAIDPSTMQITTANVNSGATTYTQTLRTSDDVTTLMSSVTSAEGSYSPETFSVKASATVNYLTSSEVSTNTLTFYLGETQLLKKSQISNVNNVQLTPDAFAVFQSDPQNFLDSYGPHFISYINYGATFAGSLSLWEQSSANKQSLSAFVNIEASNLFFSVDASESFAQSFSEVQSTLSSQMTATYSGNQNLLQYNVSSPTDLGQAYQNWGQSVSADSAPPITMLFVNYFEIPQVANYIAGLTNATEHSMYMSLFSPPRISSDTTAAINNEAIQTSNLVTALKQAKSFHCYTSNPQGSFAQSIYDQLQLASNHLNLIENQMNEAAILQVQNEGSNSPFFQAAAMQSNLTSLFQTYPECESICPGYAAWTTPMNNGAYLPGINVYRCATLNTPVSGIAFDHNSGDFAGWRDLISLECLDTSGLKANIYSDAQPITTPGTTEAGCDGTFNVQTCPQGYYVSEVHLSHEADGDNLIDSRSFSLVCTQLNTSTGYHLGNPVPGPLVQKLNCLPDQNLYQCPIGSVMVGLEFTHRCGENYIYQESFLVQCAEITGSDFYCAT